MRPLCVCCGLTYHLVLFVSFHVHIHIDAVNILHESADGGEAFLSVLQRLRHEVRVHLQLQSNSSLSLLLYMLHFVIIKQTAL